METHAIRTVSALKGELGLRDRAANLVVLDRNGVKNELDVAFMARNRLFVIECVDKDLSFGPPASMRISPEEMEMMAVEHGYVKIKTVDLGFNYLMEFRKMEP